MLTINVVFLICFVTLCITLVLCPIDGKYALFCVMGLIGISGGMTYIYAQVIEHKADSIRRLRFQYKSDITLKDLLDVVQKALENNPEMTVRMKNDEFVSVDYKKHTFDILISWNNTFCVWWKRTEDENIRLKNRYSTYRVARETTTFIAYEIQKAFEISEIK